MNSSFFQFSLLKNQSTDLSFNEWLQTHQHYQQKQDRLLWGGSFIGSSIFLISIAWIGFHLPHKKNILPVEQPPPAILLDLSTDLAPASPPPMAVQPETLPLEDQTIPLDAPTAVDPEITLPTIQNIEKIKPIQHKKVIIKQQKNILPIPQTTNNTAPSSSTIPTASSNDASSNNPSNSSSNSKTKTSMSPKTWQGLILQKLERLKHYPIEAQNEKQKGIATVKITINRDGHVLGVQLVKSSGYSLLDKEAIALPHRADPLPIVPNTITGNKVTLTVPIEFYLN